MHWIHDWGGTINKKTRRLGIRYDSPPQEDNRGTPKQAQTICIHIYVSIYIYIRIPIYIHKWLKQSGRGGRGGTRRVCVD